MNGATILRAGSTYSAFSCQPLPKGQRINARSGNEMPRDNLLVKTTLTASLIKMLCASSSRRPSVESVLAALKYSQVNRRRFK